jgi:hypothetical protein
MELILFLTRELKTDFDSDFGAGIGSQLVALLNCPYFTALLNTSCLCFCGFAERCVFGFTDHHASAFAWLLLTIMPLHFVV